MGEHFFDGVVDVALVAAIGEAGGEEREEVEFGTVWGSSRAPPAEAILGPVRSGITTRDWCVPDSLLDTHGEACVALFCVG